MYLNKKDNFQVILIALIIIIIFSFTQIVYSQPSGSGVVLIGFNTSNDLQKIIVDPGASISLTGQYVTEGDSALALNFAQTNGLPGISIYVDSLNNKEHDWSSFGIFALDITNSSTQQNQLGIWIQDQSNKVYYEFINFQSQNTSHLEFNINDLKSKLDVSNITLIRFFMNHPLQSTSFVIDNIRLLSISTSINILEPFYNHAFYSSYNEPLLKAAILISPSPSLGMNAISKLISKNGTVLDSVISPSLIDSNNIEFPSSAIAAGDTATLSVTIKNSQGADIDQTSQNIIKYLPNNNEVVIRDDGVTLVNGKPFFPIGIFQSPETDLDTIKNFGFNTAQSYVYPYLSYMQTANNLGLMVLPLVPDGLAGSFFNPNSFSIYVNQLKNYPSLLGYYYFDEPSPTNITWDLMKQVDDFTQSQDPYHPATGVNNNDQSYYAGSSDIMMIDAYPINYPAQGFPWIINRLKEGINSMKGKGPVWFVPQAFPWQPYFWYGDFPNGKYDSTLSRPPTYKELRAETWLGITMGVQGIIYYSYEVCNLYVKDAYPVMWKSLNYVVNEMDRLQDILTSDEQPPLFQVNDTSVYILSKSFNGDSYFFAVNPTLLNKVIRYQVPTNIMSLNVISEGRVIPINGGFFSDTINSYETHIYTTSDKYNDLPDIKTIDSVLSKMPTHFLSNDILNVAKGAKLTSSWGFPTSDSYWPWYTMIDANEYTAYVPNASPGDWIEVDLPQVESIRTITVVSNNLQCDIQVFNNGNWQSEPITEVIPAGYLHFEYKGNYQTAIFPEVQSSKIRIVMKNGNTGVIPIFEIEAFSTEVDPTLVEPNNSANIPANFKLFQNYPNPFNPTTNIRYTIPQSSFVNMKIYNLLGEEISTLVSKEQKPGTYEINFNGNKLASGIYLYRLSAGNYSDEKKLILLK